MKRLKNWLVLLAVITGVFCTPVICHGEEITDKSDMVASDDERAPSQSVGEDDMVPVYGSDIADGIYEIEAESSSSMFRIVKAELTVDQGKMTAVITLSGTGYLKLYMGTGEQAVEAQESDYAQFAEDAEGAYTYTIPVEALDMELECTGFSKRKEKWYDHQILFRSDSLPDGAVFSRICAEPAVIDAEDGTYTMEVTLAGGTGRAAITTPTTIIVKDKTGTALIQWSSSNYDYMIVNGETYLPVNTEGNSEFEIPVMALDEEMEVKADTTAMSTPHEIEYTLTFDSATLTAEKEEMSGILIVAAAAVCVLVVIVLAAVWIVSRKRKHPLKDENV